MPFLNAGRENGEGSSPVLRSMRRRLDLGRFLGERDPHCALSALRL